MIKALSNSDKPAPVDIKCRRGDTFYRKLIFKYKAPDESTYHDEDFTGSTFKLQVKLTGKLIMEFADADIVVTGNEIELKKTAADMAAIKTGTFKYDLQQTLADGSVKTRMAGSFIVTEDYTI